MTGPAGGPVTVNASAVPVGGGVILAAHLVVVTQPSAGEFKAFSAICTHQQCPVTQVSQGEIICPCHGSRFDITTGAPTPESPAKLPLGPKPVTLAGDTVTVA